jgi:hypothetical protein
MSRSMNSWNPLFEAAQLGFEAQCVVALRLMRLAGGGRIAAREASRMVAEKAAAMVEAQLAAARAVAGLGRSRNAAQAAFGTYKRAVRRNRRRLSRAR